MGIGAITVRRSGDPVLDSEEDRQTDSGLGEGPQAPSELCTLYFVGAQLDGARICVGRVDVIAGAAQQLSVRRVEWLIAIQPGVDQQRSQQGQAGPRPVGEADRGGMIQRDHWRGPHSEQRRVQSGDLARSIESGQGG